MDSFLVRNPLFPVEQFYQWTKNTDPDVEKSKDILRIAMREFYRQPMVQEALYIGSPDLHEQMLLWLDDKLDKADRKEKAELSLVKYMIRMCARCTPYGLFASCTQGVIGDQTAIILEDKQTIQRHGRLDMDYSGQVLSHLLSNPEISDQLVFYPNTSLYPLGENFRYIEHRFNMESGRSYHLVQVPKSVYLEKIFEAAKQGKSPEKLAAVITDHEISHEEAIGFIHELIVNQVLISDLEPNVTGDEYFHVLLSKLKKLRHTEKYVEQFEKVVNEFEQIKNGNGEKNKYYHKIAAHLRELEVPVHLKTLIQVDSYRPASVSTLNKKVCDELLYASSLIQLLSPASASRDAFADFKSQFSLRYESQWIPLVEVLDTESGIGFGKFETSGMEESPLIDKLPIGVGNGSGGGNGVSDAELYKWQMYHEAILSKKTEIVIDDKVIEELSKREYTPEGLPDSAYAMAKILAASGEDIDNGNYQLIMHVPAGPSGSNLLGRFCHLHPDIEKLARETLQKEEAHAPDCIYAEIVHLPESRVGNILMRPVLRAYEIPYLCGTQLDKEFQIPVTDIMVGVQSNKVVLWSKKLNKQIVPRMSTAHNFALTTLPVYHFLCDLQYQQIKGYGWNWGVLDNRPFLPRVTYGKYILSKAKWMLTKEDIKELDRKNDALVFEKFQEIVQAKNLPQFVLLSQGDNELLLDLKNIFCVKLLLSEVNKYHQVLLIETFDNIEKCWIKSKDGHHSGEFIFTFDKQKIEVRTSQVPSESEQNQIEIERYFPVGSSWLYAKIYCGTKTAEKILAETIRPFVQDLKEHDLIDKYFFLRYNDSGSHIRIRFHHALKVDFWKDVIDGLHHCLAPFVKNLTVHNIQFETYQREVERYGFDTMEAGEEIFYYQSDSILNFIALLDGDEGEQYRWQVALKAIDFFLDDFTYSLVQKRDLIKSLHEGFSSEFNISGPQQKKISERFSNNKKLIQQLMGPLWEEDENLKQAIKVFKITDPHYFQAIEAVLSARSINHDMSKVNGLMASYLHMFINRMFISNQRKVELVIYDYLLKVYETKIAIEKNKKPSGLKEAESAK